MCHEPSQSPEGGSTFKPSMRLIRAIDGPSPGIASSDALNAPSASSHRRSRYAESPSKVLVPRCKILWREITLFANDLENDFETSLARHHDPIDLSKLDGGARGGKRALRNEIAGAIHLVRALQPRGEVYHVAHDRIAHHHIRADATDQRLACRNTDP